MTCEACIHFAVCDKQRITNHKISKSVCKHFKGKTSVQEVRHGKWEKIEKENVWGKMTPVLRCSVCKKWKTRNLGIDFPFDYCPNCGAKMDEKKIER